MKTNHQRGFKATRSSREVFSSYIVGSWLGKVPEADVIVGASVTCGDHTNGKRGIAKDKRGAKKFVRSRVRFHQKAALRKAATEE